MSYLILSDYKKQIQSLNLIQVTGGDNSILVSWQLIAQEKVISYLRQKYDTASEFTDTNVWDITRVYNANDRVYLDGPAYNATSTYGLTDLTLQAGNVYECSVAITVGEAFNIAHWDLLGPQYTMYFGALPQPLFNINQFYNPGDQVFWKNKTYTAARPSIQPDPIQYSTTANIPPINYFPDQLINNQPNQQWGAGIAYSIAAGTVLTDGTTWTAGDNRSQQMVQTCIDIVLYFVHQRISPNNIPELRHNNYLMAIDWLKDCAKGTDVTPNLPKLQPNQGARIRMGGQPKLNNHY